MLTTKKLIHQIFCDHKGINIRKLFTIEFFKDEIKCIRCGMITKKSALNISKKDFIIKEIQDKLLILFILFLIAVCFYLAFFILIIYVL